jgi:hypothetical protein
MAMQRTADVRRTRGGAVARGLRWADLGVLAVALQLL